MIGDPYEVADDPAYYPGTHVLRNIPDLRTAEELERFEVEEVGRRSLQPPPPGNFDPAYYCALHRHLFQDVYAWAGEYRTIRTSKGGSVFCYPENIDREMTKLFATLREPAFEPDGDLDIFIAATADFLGYLNHIHPFREGNGRTQLHFIRLLGLETGHAFRSEAIERDAFLRAMIDSFHGKMEGLIDELERMLA